jgi:hypothetical protein
MARCTVPLWVVVTSWTLVCVLVASLSVFGIMYTSTRDRQRSNNALLSDELERESTRLADELVHDLHEAAWAVYDSEPLLQSCSMPASGYSPEHLVRLFNALSSPERPLGSLGIIQRASGTANGKVSWQVAAGYGCPDYMYARAEPASYPNFTGTCAYPLNGSLFAGPPAYTGVDWGLKPAEAALLQQQAPGSFVFLPVFPLLGYYTLTYEAAVEDCDAATANGTYAAVFAEQSLAKLDRALESLAGSPDSATNTTIIVLIVERATGFLVSASVPNQTQHVVAPTQIDRVHFANASDERVRAVAQTMGGRTDNVTDPAGTSWTEGDYWVTAVPYGRGVDWVLIAAFPQATFLQALYSASSLSIGLSMGVIVIVAAVSPLLAYFCVARPLGAIARYVDTARTSDDYERVENESYFVGEIEHLRSTVHGHGPAVELGRAMDAEKKGKN